uniref:Uncharacterized protein n=1 Tax=Hyaloperonospora arabidopsidis (strain Emoy2) TaxID=559515 RepID=M4C327_HYAAE
MERLDVVSGTPKKTDEAVGGPRKRGRVPAGRGVDPGCRLETHRQAPGWTPHTSGGRHRPLGAELWSAVGLSRHPVVSRRWRLLVSDHT